jgi:hypothetical protein
MKTTSIVNFYVNLRPPFVNLHVLQTSWPTFLVSTLEENDTYALLIICTLMPQITPLLTLMLVYTWGEGSHPGNGVTRSHIQLKCNKNNNLNYMELQM